MRLRSFLIWAGLVALMGLPVLVAGQSPLLEWRDGIYIAAGFAGVVAMSLLLLQPLLMSGALPGLSLTAGRRFHGVVGSVLLLSVVVHVVGLWLTSPPDVVDALLYRSPTPFSVWGVSAMWALFLAAGLMAARSYLPWRVRYVRLAHLGLVAIVVLGSILHALLIQGTMELLTKWALCGSVALALIKVLLDRRSLLRRSKVAQG
ncbi:ferric reductase [Epibacterium sp. SM1979]|uniref:Ferric reductase n=1 Tax=Tritonibacter litoralis TaxID=2662264 RepID=A0A843YKE5_9RHOB|nr:ferric reductase [Tritonibacter litoralis]MQQ09874.1 ferric reductase [Tritonibacter litoralis]